MKYPIKITLPWPPTVNTYWRHVVMNGSARTMLSKKGRQYREAAAHALMFENRGVVLRGLTDRLAVHILASPPDRRARDLDNLPKGILDALTHAEVWLDDSQIDDLRTTRCPVVKGGRIELTITQHTEIER